MRGMDNAWLESIQVLKASYRATERMLRKAFKEATDPADQELLSGMISDCMYAIEWMHSSRAQVIVAELNGEPATNASI